MVQMIALLSFRQLICARGYKTLPQSEGMMHQCIAYGTYRKIILSHEQLFVNNNMYLACQNTTINMRLVCLIISR